MGLADERFARLPGFDLVSTGVTDLAERKRSVPALLVASFSARLRVLGVEVPNVRIDEPEHELYGALAQEEPDGAHAQYNALVRRIVSFAEAAECVS